MIKHIYVKNYALIKELRLDLDAGFTTLTGETGAGKSILLGALGLVLGNRADVKALADEDQKCVVEAHFEIADLHLADFFADNELDFDTVCILRREILPSGKTRAFVNDTPVLLDVLKDLGERLVDVHSQHDSLLLMNANFQLEMLDTLAGNEAERQKYTDAYQHLSALKAERVNLLAKLDVKRDTDYLQFLVDELAAARITAGEEETIESELKILRHAEEIQINVGAAANHLNDENAVLQRLHEAIKHVETVKSYLPEADSLLERLRSAEIELKDLATELEVKATEVSLDEERLNTLEERNNALQNLMQKHRVVSAQELLEKLETMSNELYLATAGAQEIARLEAEISASLESVKEHGNELSATRKSTAQKLEIQVADYLERLQLKGAMLYVNLEAAAPKPSGTDQINLLFTANAGSKPQPLHKVASGGELSRVMLALKAILAKTKSLPAIIFDEIDTGISGETANRVADILNEMGQSMQVLAITHLPQIAARGAQQLQVAKASLNGTTATQITLLTSAERVEEIARLLSGAQVTEAARKTAEELLANV
jgi:DNA repair protein RecN (Recombination protein N)